MEGGMDQHTLGIYLDCILMKLLGILMKARATYVKCHCLDIIIIT